MAKIVGNQVSKLLNFVVWLTGILVSLAVGFAMVGETLTVPWLDAVGAGIVTIIAGYIVIATTVIGAVLAILKK